MTTVFLCAVPIKRCFLDEVAIFWTSSKLILPMGLLRDWAKLTKYLMPDWRAQDLVAGCEI
jgi:hypothetical protein